VSRKRIVFYKSGSIVLVFKDNKIPKRTEVVDSGITTEEIAQLNPNAQIIDKRPTATR
jgi:hypothetical protein